MPLDRPLAADDGDDSLVVDLIGANQRLRDTLVMVFRGPAKGRCSLATGTEARAVVVNLDGVGAETEWARYRERFPDRPAIVLALDDHPVEHATAVVAKPVRIDRFLAAIDLVQAGLRAPRQAPVRAAAAPPVAAAVTASRPAVPALVPPAPEPVTPRPVAAEEERTQAYGDCAVDHDRWERLCGSAPDCNLDDPALAAGRRFTGSTRLLDCIRSAIDSSRRDGKPVDVRLRERPIVTILADSASAACVLSDDQLAALCGTTLDEDFIDAAPAASGDAAAGATTVTLDALLWKLALWTFRGQLPADAALDQRMYLSHWPNLTRLASVPNATRIAALLIRHPMQLARVAEALRIPQRHVFAFFAAASAIGLMGIARRESDHLVEQTPPEPHSRRSLLGRIAQHLPRDDFAAVGSTG